MPILVKDYSWTETKDKVHVTVPLKGVKTANVGLLCTNEFLKANYPPFLFEALLYKEIDDDKSVAKIRDGAVEFNLVKVENEIWGKLLSEKSEDKAFMLKKKLEAVEYVQKQTERQQKEALAKKTTDKRYTVKEMMRLEEEEKSRIELVKETERKNAEDEMERWKQLKKEEEMEEKKKLAEERLQQSLKNVDDLDIINLVNGEAKAREPAIEKSQDIFNAETMETDDVVDDKSSNNEKKTVAAKPRGSQPRQGGNIKFKFTPRVFPTPLRESKTQEEEEWLQKQAEARKTTELNDTDLEEHEKDPDWLKEKGNKLFASGSFLAAVNAYNLAIRIQPKNHLLYLNRSACHLKLRNFYKCLDDCSRALDLLQPPVPANANARLKAHIRKGTAFCELELYAEGLLDYNEALKIDPNNEQLKKDAESIKEAIEKGDADATVMTS
uniref:dynein assembly factor 4, axonemal-like n=1 Tax=Styela clava TaxID=7725 RepID=UPI0019392FB1|nr:dynein assembly factor 4, axonemal-like [Styela clava]